MVVADRIVDLVVDARDGVVGVGLDQGRDLVGDLLGHLGVAGPLGARHPEGHDGAPVERREGAGLGGGVRHRAELVEPRLAPPAEHDRQGGEVGHGAGAGEGADGLFLAGDLAAAAREVHVGGPQLRRHAGRRDAERQQLARVERHPDLAVHAARARHLADAPDRLQLARHRVVHEPRDLLGRAIVRRDRIGHDGQALDVEPLDDRLVDGAGQLDPDLRDLVLHVVEGAIDVGADVELDGGRRGAVRNGRDDVPDAGNARDGVLDLLGDLGLELGRRRARLGDGHLDDGDVDVRQPRHRQRAEAHEAEDHQHREGQERRHGPADRPGRDG